MERIGNLVALCVVAAVMMIVALLDASALVRDVASDAELGTAYDELICLVGEWAKS